MLEVCCAIVQYKDKVLVAQRSEQMLLPLKWEFPGGKIEATETREECIKRELKEELALPVEVIGSLTAVTHHYESFSLNLYPLLCRTTTMDCIVKEHQTVQWVSWEDLSDFDWAAADIPIVEEYVEKMKNQK
ncbi:MAG: (deoxy)nucleoside triphosphate pyrophosphohydrolase [Flavobacteriaceae bacterium]|jgi:8-oxo-dGTP diphosphatase|nr:(deoxy)nucleoside triphosphate pyrophosphohydrolase [Flavobacteriaceae bacterium]